MAKNAEKDLITKRVGILRSTIQTFGEERMIRMRNIQSQITKVETNPKTSELFGYVKDYLCGKEKSLVCIENYYPIMKMALDNVLNIDMTKLERKTDWTKEEFYFVQLYILVANQKYQSKINMAKLEAATLLGRTESAINFAYNNNRLNTEIKRLEIADFQKMYNLEEKTAKLEKTEEPNPLKDISNGLEQETSPTVEEMTVENIVPIVVEQVQEPKQEINILETLKVMALANKELNIDLNYLFGLLTNLMNKALGNANYEAMQQRIQDLTKEVEKEQQEKLVLQRQANEKQSILVENQKLQEQLSTLQKRLDLMELNATRLLELRSDEQLIYVGDLIESILSNAKDPVVPLTGVKVKMERNGNLEVIKK